MRNGDDDQEPVGTPPGRRCGHCGLPLLSQRRHAKYCDRTCKELARAARKRAGDRLTTLRSNHPLADISLADDDDAHQDDEAGIYSGSTTPVYESDRRFHQAIRRGHNPPDNTAGRPQDRYDPRTSGNIAARATASRKLNSHHVEQPPPLAGQEQFDYSEPNATIQGPRGGSRDYAWQMPDGFFY